MPPSRLVRAPVLLVLLVVVGLGGCGDPSPTARPSTTGTGHPTAAAAHQKKASITTYTCAQLMHDGTTKWRNSLLTVRHLVMTVDHRRDFRVSRGKGRTLVMECRGQGVFTSHVVQRIDAKVLIDSDRRFALSTRILPFVLDPHVVEARAQAWMFEDGGSDDRHLPVTCPSRMVGDAASILTCKVAETPTRTVPIYVSVTPTGGTSFSLNY